MSHLLRDLYRTVAALRDEKPLRPMSIRVSDSLHASMSAMAEREGISLHAWVLRTLEDKAWGGLPTSMFADSAFDRGDDAVSQRNAGGGRR